MTIKRCETEEQWLDSDDSWELEDHEQQSTGLSDSKVRRITPDDIDFPKGFTETDVSFAISYACKIILTNPYRQWNDIEVKARVIELNPKFYLSKLGGFVQVFRRVEELKSEWVMGYTEIEEEEKTGKENVDLVAVCEHNPDQSSSSTTKSEIIRKIGELLIQLSETL